MCILEDVFFGICGCWRTTPRVAIHCAAGKSSPYYKTYGCKNSTTVGAVHLPAERCSNCIQAAVRRGSAAFESVPQCPSSILTSSLSSSVEVSRRSSSTTQDTLDSLDTVELVQTLEDGNLNTYAIDAHPTSFSLEVNFNDNDVAQFDSLASSRQAAAYPQIRKLTSINELHAEHDFPAEGTSPYSPQLTGRKALTPFAINFNENMFAHALNESLSVSTEPEDTDIVSPDHGPAKRADVVAEREKAHALKALNFAEQMLGTIQIKCGNSNALNQARRRSSARHSTMPGMRERGLYQP